MSKKPKNSLDESNLAFYELEHLNQQIMELMNESVGINDAQFNFRYVNRAHCNLLGYEKEEFIGESTLKFVHPDFQDKVAKQLKNRL